MMFLFLLLFCRKGHGPLVLSMLVRNRWREGALCFSSPPPPSIASLPREQTFCRVQVSAPPSLPRSRTQHCDESDESPPVSVAHTGPRCQGNCQQGPCPPNPHPPRFKPPTDVSCVFTRGLRENENTSRERRAR